MKRTSRILVTLGMIISLLVISPRSSRADLFGVGDAALLAQQVFQCGQDLRFDNFKWSDIENRLNLLKKMAGTIMKGQQAYTSVNNILVSAKRITVTGRRLESYVNYLEEFGDNFRIARAHSIYKSFLRRTGNVYNDVGKTMKSFESLFDGGSKEGGASSLELLNAVNEASTELSETVSDMSESSTNDLVQLCHGVVIDQAVDNNNKFKRVNIVS